MKPRSCVQDHDAGEVASPAPHAENGAALISFREPAEHELEALADLWVESWQTLGWDIDFAGRRGWLLEHLAQLRATGAVLVGCYQGGRCVGFFTLEPSGAMDQLCVSAAQFGHGIGLRLLDEAKNRQPQGLTLSVNSDNVRALRFYLREGFAVTGEGISPRSGLKILHMRWPGRG